MKCEILFGGSLAKGTLTFCSDLHSKAWVMGWKQCVRHTDRKADKQTHTIVLHTMIEMPRYHFKKAHVKAIGKGDIAMSIVIYMLPSTNRAPSLSADLHALLPWIDSRLRPFEPIISVPVEPFKRLHFNATAVPHTPFPTREVFISSGLLSHARTHKSGRTRTHTHTHTRTHTHTLKRRLNG